MSARLLVEHMREPARLAAASAETWNALIRVSRAESLAGQLAEAARSAGIWDTLPARVRTILSDDVARAAASQRSAAWEAEQARRALRTLGAPVVLLKGTAYLLADLPPSRGRSIGDLDILVPREAIGDAEKLLREAGWEPLKDDPYDDAYYRRYMHELPPLAHAERGTLIDVHHTILPLTARITPDAGAMLADAVPLGNGLSVLAPADMLLHSVAHMFADGDFDGGLRNLWDIHLLAGAFAAEGGFWPALAERADRHGLQAALGRALRQARDLYGTKVGSRLAGPSEAIDGLIRRRLLARDEWGLATNPLARQALYVRSHWLRMPPLMLARHLRTKAWKRLTDRKSS